MVVKTFEEFVSTIYEHMKRDDVKIQGKTKSEIYTGFKNLGYKCIGNFYWSTKTYNSIIPEYIKDFFKNNLFPLEEEIFGKKRSKFGNYDNYLNINYYSKVYDYDDKFVADCILNNISNEKVVKIKEKGDLFYCFWNPSKKYYYYMSFGKKKTIYTHRRGVTIYTRNFSDIENLFDYYIFLKTEDIDKVKKKLIEIKKEEDEQKQEMERIEKEREEKRRIEKEKNDHETKILKEIDDIRNSILQDAEKNPDNYKEIKGYGDIPKHIKSQLIEKDIEKQLNNDYFKIYKIIEHGRYDDGLAQFFINNKELTDGYTYQSWISWAKPGTYWGD